ncbi:MAG: ComEA family DNA-binding protein [Candidatus Sumerlaeia bacterium]
MFFFKRSFSVALRGIFFFQVLLLVSFLFLNPILANQEIPLVGDFLDPEIRQPLVLAQADEAKGPATHSVEGDSLYDALGFDETKPPQNSSPQETPNNAASTSTLNTRPLMNTIEDKLGKARENVLSRFNTSANPPAVSEAPEEVEEASGLPVEPEPKPEAPEKAKKTVEKKAKAKPDKPDLNRVSLDELAELPAMDINRARLIIQHRKAVGGFASINDLQGVFGINEKLFKQISDNVIVGPVPDDLKKALPQAETDRPAPFVP